jgi:hypothetical protein
MSAFRIERKHRYTQWSRWSVKMIEPGIERLCWGGRISDVSSLLFSGPVSEDTLELLVR